MNAPSPVPSTRPLPLKPKWIAVGLLLLVAYLVLRPWLVERYGWDLPGFTDVQPKAGAKAPVEPSKKSSRGDKNLPVEVPVVPEQGEPVVEEPNADEQVASSDTPPKPEAPPANNPQASANTPSPTVKPQAPAQPSPTTPAKSSSTKPAGQPGPSPTTSQANTSKPKSNSPTAKPPAVAASKPAWKGLNPIGRGKFESPAGLVYDQYRIDHVMEHTRDNTEKPSHGVFDVTTQDEVLALIDEAFDLTKKRGPPQVITDDEGDRTAFTVNLNRKVGRAGGQSGARRRNPSLQKVKIVVEDTRVITAYPTN